MTSEEEPLTIATVLEATGGLLIQGNVQMPVAGVSTDSRSIKPGELFFALRGERFDGHRFVTEAVPRNGDDRRPGLDWVRGLPYRRNVVGTSC